MVATVAVSGELDCTTAPDLARRLLQVATGHPERIALDLGGLVFVDVASARALDRTYKALEEQCPVILRTPRPSSARRPLPAP